MKAARRERRRGAQPTTTIALQRQSIAAPIYSERRRPTSQRASERASGRAPTRRPPTGENARSRRRSLKKESTQVVEVPAVGRPVAVRELMSAALLRVKRGAFFCLPSAQKRKLERRVRARAAAFCRESRSSRCRRCDGKTFFSCDARFSTLFFISVSSPRSLVARPFGVRCRHCDQTNAAIKRSPVCRGRHSILLVCSRRNAAAASAADGDRARSKSARERQLRCARNENRSSRARVEASSRRAAPCARELARAGGAPPIAADRRRRFSKRPASDSSSTTSARSAIISLTPTATRCSTLSCM